jgi:EpsI family protein
MAFRLTVLASCLGLAWAYMGVAAARTPQQPSARLAEFPVRIDGWMGAALPLDRDVLDVLGVDEHVSRTYTAPGRTVQLYVGYYSTQRRGDSIHSPMNCLPGAGWVPVAAGRLRIGVDPARPPVEVNRYVIAKGLDRQLVLYWYQSQGRVVASDYWSKVYLVLDSIHRHRSDAALVRVITPLDRGEAVEAPEAERTAAAFVEVIFPVLDAHLPR